MVRAARMADILGVINESLGYRPTQGLGCFALVAESGVSSVENYECGCAPMNALREMVCATSGMFGARFSGEGFRGCVVGLVEVAEAEAAARSVREMYAAAFPELARDARVALAGTGDGAGIV